jgi:hypothetical protein
LIVVENFWLSRLFVGFKAQTSQQIEKSLPKYAENWLFLYSEWEKLLRLTSIFRSGLIGWSQSKLLGLESWSRENWDFSILINIYQMSRQHRGLSEKPSIIRVLLMILANIKIIFQFTFLSNCIHILVLLRRYKMKKCVFLKKFCMLLVFLWFHKKWHFLGKNPIFFTVHFIKISIKTEPLGIFWNFFFYREANAMEILKLHQLLF